MFISKQLSHDVISSFTWNDNHDSLHMFSNVCFEAVSKTYTVDYHKSHEINMLSRIDVAFVVFPFVFAISVCFHRYVALLRHCTIGSKRCQRIQQSGRWPLLALFEPDQADQIKFIFSEACLQFDTSRNNVFRSIVLHSKGQWAHASASV
jgi:hypothetical protein